MFLSFRVICGKRQFEVIFDSYAHMASKRFRIWDRSIGFYVIGLKHFIFRLVPFHSK